MYLSAGRADTRRAPLHLMERERVATRCLDYLEARGLSVHLVSNPDSAKKLLDSTGRTFSTLPLDPDRVAFTRSNAVWMFAIRKNGAKKEVYMGCGVRLDDIRDEPFDEYYRRTSKPTYGEPTRASIERFPSAPLQGKIAYWGDLISPPIKDKSLSSVVALRMFCFYGQHRIFTDYGADCSYCFMLDRQYIRGAPQAYGFLSSLPFVWDWRNCPFPGGKPDWVSYTQKNEIPFLTKSVARLQVNKIAVDN